MARSSLAMSPAREGIARDQEGGIAILGEGRQRQGEQGAKRV